MQLADLDLNKLYTYADYYKWTFEERVELIKGKVFNIVHPNTNHQVVLGNIYTALANFLEDELPIALIAPLDVRFTNDPSTDDNMIVNVMQPDLIVVCDSAKIDRRGCIGAPDIIVEVLSPGNNAKEFKHKYDIYEASGVKEYWIVSPQHQTFLVHVNINGKFQPLRLKTNGDVITTDILPGFALDLTELFSEIDSENW